MKKQLAGGLIVFTLMSDPILFFTKESYTLGWHKQESDMISAYIDVLSQDLNDETTTESLMRAMQANSSLIASLMREKNSAVASVFDDVKMKAKLKMRVSEAQQVACKKFFASYEDRAERLRENLHMLHHRKNLRLVKNELQTGNTNFDRVCQDLREVYFYQADSIECLYEIIDFARDFHRQVEHE